MWHKIKSLSLVIHTKIALNQNQIIKKAGFQTQTLIYRVCKLMNSCQMNA